MTDKTPENQKTTDMSQLRKTIPTTLKTLQMAIEDALDTPIDKINGEDRLSRQANTMDTASRVLLAHALLDPAKANPSMVRVALEAANISTATLAKLTDIRWKNKMMQAEFPYENSESAEQKEGY
ncbi:MAG: hypothetical protein DHS20C02_04660 [Micavibrio sp.]|nr:MAG: hypothetical protein DHS20C02_04660 [Micavibrio sp.]